MSDTALQKLQKEHDKQIEKLEKEIDRLLEEIRIMESYNDYEQDH
jgi:TolA-binding protein